jgi:hypothetical protein
MSDCPKCMRPMERREGMFYWRGEVKPGLFCPPCNALWSVPGEEIEPLRPAPITLPEQFA